MSMLDELAQIEAFDEETAQELQNRAIEFIEARNKEMDDKRQALGVEDEVLEVEGVTPAMAVALGEREHQDAGRSGRLRHRRSARLLRDRQGQGARARFPARWKVSISPATTPTPSS